MGTSGNPSNHSELMEILRVTSHKLRNWLDALKRRFSSRTDRSVEQHKTVKILKKIISAVQSYSHKSTALLTEYELFSRKTFHGIPPQLDDELITTMIQTMNINLQKAWEKSSLYNTNEAALWDAVNARIKDLSKTMEIRDVQWSKFESLDKKLKKLQTKLAKINTQLPTDTDAELTEAQVKSRAEAAVLSSKITDLSSEIYAQVSLHKEHDEKVKSDLENVTNIVNVVCTVLLTKVTVASTTFHAQLNDAVVKDILPSYVEYCDAKFNSLPSQMAALLGEGSSASAVSEGAQKTPEESQNSEKNNKNTNKNLKVTRPQAPLQNNSAMLTTEA